MTNHFKLKKRVRDYVGSLTQEGYIIISEGTCSSIFVLLKHRNNGNKIRIIGTDGKIRITKNGKTIKEETV